MRRSTDATDEYPGPVQHFAVVCVDHVVDVISTASPTVRLRACQPDA
jgi:hypothetical protein